MFQGRLIGSFHRGKVLLAAGALAAAIPLSGCSVSVADLPMVGVPEGAPARPKDPGAFPAVHDMPADRADPALDRDEQARIQSELSAARDHQAATAAAGANAPPAGKK